ncbi:MAG: phenylacetic acid degradation protein [Rhizobiaceae bacterium]|nr:phenylacetic acid degradation protein [Rhizobiaceae bacterium]MCV0409153.1 phenylacetic acid degradation protein [Rhizobiaceae bacterium]
MDQAVNPAEMATEALIDLLHSRGRLRVWSLVVTVFGDAIVPRGGRVGLGVLQDVLGRLRIESGAVRTAMSRLARDGWVTRERDGRNAYYRLADQGRHAFDQATRKIYAPGPPAWNGKWTVVLLPATGAPDSRSVAAEQLAGAGFVAVGDAAWVRPDTEGAVEPVLPPQAFVMRGRAAPAGSIGWMWDLDELTRDYRGLIGDLSPLAKELCSGARLDPLSALAARVLVNHMWRRIVLRDPELPETLLPEDWLGERARAVVRSIYRALAPASEAWLDEAGLPPATDPARAASRFGGI